MAAVRTFIAVLLSDELKLRIASVQDRFKTVAPDFKWVAPENFHVTLKFLGGVEERKLDSVFEAVSRAAVGLAPFELVISGAGAFPNPRRPRVVWVGSGAGANELSELAARVDSELEAVGFPREERGFKAHITIGRAKDGRWTPDLADVIGDVGLDPLGAVMVDRVSVMKSVLQPTGPVYSVLHELLLR